jgi:hypothetical protein
MGQACAVLVASTELCRTLAGLNLALRGLARSDARTLFSGPKILGKAVFFAPINFSQ